MIFWLERHSLGFPGPRACSTWMDSLLACGASGPHLRHMRPAQSKLAQVENFHGGLNTPSLIILISCFEQSDDDPEVALKSSFWDGVREGGGGSVPHCCKEKEFDQGEWQEACRKLFPKSLTKLLNGCPAKVPKWLAKKWALYYRLPLEKKLLGRK